MRSWIPALLLLPVGACAFQSQVNAGDDAGVDAVIIVPDAPPRPDGAANTMDDVVHVGRDDEYFGTADLTISAPLTIDTTRMSFGMALPAGVTFGIAPQDGKGPELAILHVRNLTVGAAVRASGSRPLVVIADAIDIMQTIDVAGHHGEPGAGAQATTEPGSAGLHAGTYNDSGGGGGGHGTAGATGGPTACKDCPNKRLDGGGAGPASNPQVAMLVGGAPGGRTYSPLSACHTQVPGAGGGAIELYARTRIEISGNINAGGGGGLGGQQCNQPYNWLAGHGGGAGGTIVLQAPTIENTGRLSANGGGGGAGGGSVGNGGAGEDGALGVSPAKGGATSGMYSAAGGDGAAGGTAARPGAPGPESGNAGGGGGGLGQIQLLYQATVAAGVTSPTAITATYVTPTNAR
jgi:hypothetical protein